MTGAASGLGVTVGLGAAGWRDASVAEIFTAADQTFR
jgi:hypothetical protein